MSSSPKNNRRRNCSVFGCLVSSVSNSEASFFTLPVDTERRLQWLLLIDREDLTHRQPNNYFVCEKHFDERDLMVTPNRMLLKKNSLPTLHLPDSRKKDEEVQVQPATAHASTQTEKMIVSDNITQTPVSLLTPRKRKRKSAPSGPNKRVKNQEELNQDAFHKLCERFLPEDVVRLVKAKTVLNNIEDSDEDY